MEKLQEKHIDQFKQEKKEKVLKETQLDENEKKILDKIYEEAKRPVVLQDGEVQCGPNEIDIRELSRSNKDQMEYRVQVMNMVYLRRMNDTLNDVANLIMTLLHKLGVENLAKEMEDALTGFMEKSGLGNRKVN